MTVVKTLFIGHSSRLGGAQNHMLGLVGAMDQTRVLPVVALPDQGPMFDEFARLQNVPCLRLVPFHYWVEWLPDLDPMAILRFGDGFEERVRGIAELINQHQIDVVVSHTMCFVEGAIAARMASKPHVWYVQEIPRTDPALSPHLGIPFAIRTILQLSTYVVAISEAVAGQLRSVEDADNVRVIHNAIDIEAYLASIDRSKRKSDLFQCDQDAPTVLFAGQFIERKGIGDLAKAIPRVLDVLPDAIFVLAGNRGQAEADQFLQQLTDACKRNVRILGFRNDLPDLINNADLVVQPALADAFNLVTLEAMIAGTPIIGTRSGGMEELIVDEVTGRLVPPGSHLELADCIIQFLGDSGQCRRMAKLAQERARTHFDLSLTARKVEELLQMAASAQRPETDGEAELLESLSQFGQLYRELIWLRQFHARITSHPAWKINRAVKYMLSGIRGASVQEDETC